MWVSRSAPLTEEVLTGGVPSESPPVTGRSGALAFPEAPTGGWEIGESFIDDVR